MTREAVREPGAFAPFEWLLAFRYLRARRKKGSVSVIAFFCVIGITLGVATLIIVLSVMNGFRKELFDKILGLNGHVIIRPLARPFTDFAEAAARLNAVTEREVFAARGGGAGDGLGPVQLRGSYRPRPQGEGSGLAQGHFAAMSATARFPISTRLAG